MAIALFFLFLVVVFAVSAWASRHVRHPEDAATHDDGSGSTSTSDEIHRDTRPAGADAEDPIGPTRRAPGA
jgi:hypothetical protein